MPRVQRSRLQRRKLVLEGLERRQVLTSYFVDGDVLASGDGSSEAPFATIREGIEAALVAPGDDEVVIAPRSAGPYVETLVIAPGVGPDQVPGFEQFNGNLLIRGATGDAADVVLKSDVGSNFYINAPIDVTIEYLTLSSSKAHGLVNRSANNDVVLDHLIVSDHLLQSPYVGSGIVQQGKNMTIRNTQVFNNYQGIWVGRDQQTGQFEPNSLTVENTVSSGNRVNGLHVNSMTGTLTTTDFSGSNNTGSGVNISNVASVSITGGTFDNNSYRGIELHDLGAATIQDVHAGNNKLAGLMTTHVSNLLIQGGYYNDNVYKGLAIWDAHGATIDGVHVEGNGSLQGNDQSGGAGIKVQPATGEPIVIKNSFIRNNESNRWGAGFEMYNFSGPATTITFSNTEISGNKTPVNSSLNGRGGGISVYGNGNLEILDSKILNNQAGEGGGVYHYSFATYTAPSSSLTVSGSTFDGNVSYISGGLERFNGQTTITNSTFSHNTSSNGSGGLRVSGSTGSMTNVTVSENTSTWATGGMTVESRSSFSIVNSTIVNNTGRYVGGLYLYGSGRLANTVVAQNHTTYPYSNTPDISGVVTSHGGNFIGNATGGYGFNPSTDFLGSQFNPLDPKLGALQDNGGKTLTHKPLLDSLLRDKGVASSLGVTIPTTDQRGVARPQRLGIDIGAVEAENIAPTLVVDSTTITLDEGQTAENSGAFSDIEGDDVTLTASVGTLTVGPGGTWQWSLGTDDGPSDGTTVTITAEDEFGGITVVEFDVVVENVAPTAQISATSPVQSGESTTLTLSASDVSQADLDAGFTYRIDWDSDGTFDEEVSGSTASHVFTALGLHTITAVAIDKDGGTSQPVSTTISVYPAPLAIVGDASVNLNAASNGKKRFEVVVLSTDTLDARDLDEASIVWAGAHVSRSTYRDADGDGDIDAVFGFVLSESNVVDLYRQALANDPSNNHQTVVTELTATGSNGTHYLGAAEVDLVMNGQALKDLLDSM